MFARNFPRKLSSFIELTIRKNIKKPHFLWKYNDTCVRMQRLMSTFKAIEFDLFHSGSCKRMNCYFKPLITTLVCICFFLVSVLNSHAVCITGSNYYTSPTIEYTQSAYSDIIFSGYPSNAVVYSASVYSTYSKNPGATLRFYLNKLNNNSNWFNYHVDTQGFYLSNYFFAVNNIIAFNNSPINGTWRISMYHDSLYQSPNAWGPSYNDCTSCHQGALLNRWSLTLCYNLLCNLVINTFTKSVDTFVPLGGDTVNFNGSISEGYSNPITWTLTVAGRSFYGNGGTVSVIWDGKDVNGNFVPNGAYTAILTAQSAGQCLASKAVIVNVSSVCAVNITNFTQTATRFNPNPPSSEQVTFTGDFTDPTSNQKTWTITVADRTFSGTDHTINATWNGRDSLGAIVNEKTYPVTLTVQYPGCIDATSLNVTAASQPLSPSDAPDTCGAETNSLVVASGSNTNILTGNLSHSQELFITKGRALSTAVSLYYNSLATDSGALGPGWRHNYEVYLTINADNSIVIKDGDGGARRYLSNGNGTYRSQLGDSSTLIKNGSGSGATYRVTYRNGMSELFDYLGKIKTTQDRFFNTVTFGYTGSDMTSITDPAGRVTTLNYISGKLNWVKDPNLNQYDFLYDGNGRLWRVTNPVADPLITSERGYWEYTYENGLLKTKKDPEGNTFEYSYDGNNRVSTVKDPEWLINPAAHTRSYTYPANANSIDSGSVTEKDGGTWTYLIDGSNRALKKRFDPSGVETSYTYYVEGMIKSRTELAADGNRYTTFYSYDDYGNLTRETVPTDLTKLNPPITPEAVQDADSVPIYDDITYSYGTYDRVTQITDYRGSAPLTTYVFRDMPWPSTTLKADNYIDPELNETDYIYNTDGSINSIYDGNYKATIYSYYANGLLLSIKGPDNILYTIEEYDNNGNVKKTTTTGSSGGVKTVDYTYTALNSVKSRTTSSTNMAAETVNYTYDHNNRLASVTDSDTRFVRYKYSFEGKLKEVTDTLLNKATFDYVGTGCATCRDGGTSRLNTVTDAKQQPTSYLFDTLGNLEREIDPLGKIIRYTYYPNNKLKEKIDASATPELILVTYGYDKEGHLTSANYSGGSYETYTYDASGRMKTATNNNIGYTFEYYDNNWLKSVTDSKGKIITYDLYSGIGQLKQVTLLSGSSNQRVIVNSYNSVNRLGGITAKGRNGSEPDRTFGFTYDTYGRRYRLTYPSTTEVWYQFDDLDRVSSISHIIPSGTSFTPYLCSQRDAAGNCLVNIGTKPVTFVYDELYRLKFAYGTTNYEEFQFDGAGNRTQGPGQGDTGYIPTAANQIEKGREFQYSYDTSGNQTARILADASDKSEIRTWNAANRLSKVERSKVTPSGIDKRTVSYKYDPFGRRIEKNFVNTVNGKSSTETYSYAYDREDIIQEIYTKTSSSGTTTSTTNYIHGPGTDELFAMERDGQWYYFHADNLGSIVKITDANKNIVQSYDYDTYGMLKPSTAFRNSITYTGREWDAETGLYYYRGRYYDPLDGIFISKDPLRFAGGDTNLYRYVGGNPVNRIDPFGLWSVVVEGYAGVGGGITIGKNPNGSWFYSAKVGAGEGGGFQFDRKGTSPGYDGKCKTGTRNINFGLFMGANASIGPVSGGYNMGAGAHLQAEPDNVSTYDYTGPNVQIGKSFGGRVGFALGFELSGIGAAK